MVCERGSQGKLIAVATYCSHNLRNFKPLINISLTNEELGWQGSEWSADTEVHYTDMYNELLTHIKGAAPIRKYNEKCKVNLPI